jgi:hypothetical protein
MGLWAASGDPCETSLARRDFWHFGGILLENRQFSREFADFPFKGGTPNYGANL